jgi:hypothetical protein
MGGLIMSKDTQNDVIDRAEDGVLGALGEFVGAVKSDADREERLAAERRIFDAAREHCQLRRVERSAAKLDVKGGAS